MIAIQNTAASCLEILSSLYRINGLESSVKFERKAVFYLESFGDSRWRINQKIHRFWGDRSHKLPFTRNLCDEEVLATETLKDVPGREYEISFQFVDFKVVDCLPTITCSPIDGPERESSETDSEIMLDYETVFWNDSFQRFRRSIIDTRF